MNTASRRRGEGKAQMARRSTPSARPPKRRIATRPRRPGRPDGSDKSGKRRRPVPPCGPRKPAKPGRPPKRPCPGRNPRKPPCKPHKPPCRPGKPAKPVKPVKPMKPPKGPCPKPPHKPAKPHCPRPRPPRLLRGKASVFVVYSDGKSRVYRDKDAAGHGIRRIPNPRTATYLNLFVNAVLQPPDHYSVSKGRLRLLTEDLPPQGTPIVLQVVRIFG